MPLILDVFHKVSNYMNKLKYCFKMQLATVTTMSFIPDSVFVFEAK